MKIAKPHLGLDTNLEEKDWTETEQLLYREDFECGNLRKPYIGLYYNYKHCI